MSFEFALTEASALRFRDGDPAATPSYLPNSSALGLSARKHGYRTSTAQRLPYAPEAVKELRQQAARELPAQLLRLAEHHGLQVSRVSVRNQRSRWGSCSPSGHICLNWRLVLMPEGVREYVLIHELMHLRRLDHSRHFWHLVAHACPGYEHARRWLRENRYLLQYEPESPICQSSNSDSLNPTDERSMIRAVSACHLPVTRSLMRAGAKEHVIENSESKPLPIDRERGCSKQFPEKACRQFVASVPRVEIGADDERAGGQR